ncbi:DUF2431 domain-containing protein [Candidatus Pacearchaeota archaeon]|nr:DUF2431 domain-containing protein [Candidatus Pacearchaeota archaeon]
MIYSPAEDSWLLEKEVKNYIKKLNKKEKQEIKVLDMGSGSGIQAKAVINSGINNNQVFCADINPEAIKYLENQGLKAIKSNLFSNLNKKSDKFDLIIFNAPYLPEDKQEPKDSKLATTAGKQGYELILEFLKQAKPRLAKQGSILLLFSNLSKPSTILEQAKTLGYKAKKLAEQNLFFEKLFVYEFRLN